MIIATTVATAIGIGVNGHAFYALFPGSEALLPLMCNGVVLVVSSGVVAYGALKTKEAWAEYQTLKFVNERRIMELK